MTIQITPELVAGWPLDVVKLRAFLDLIEREYYCRRRARPVPGTGRPRGGRMFEDPGPRAICKSCSYERSRHGGSKALGNCPTQYGLQGGRFRLRDEDKRWRATTPTSESD